MVTSAQIMRRQPLPDWSCDSDRGSHQIGSRTGVPKERAHDLRRFHVSLKRRLTLLYGLASNPISFITIFVCFVYYYGVAL